MATSEQLLHVIARLQSIQSVAQGRRMLLAHLRKVCGAQLAILFTVDSHPQQLSLLIYSGHLPHSQNTQQPEELPARKHIPLDGLFGSVLRAHEPLQLPDVYSDTRALQEERAWTWPGGRVILSAVKTGEQPASSSGLLVLCFDPQARGHTSTLYEDDLLIGSMLLSSYLSRTEEPVPSGGAPPATHNGRSSVAPVRPDEHESQRTLPEMMYSLSSLSALYELGLAVEIDEDAQVLYQHILQHIGRVVRAQGSCLMLYHPLQQRFFPGATAGERPPCASIANALHGPELERQMQHDNGETLLVIQEGGERVLLVTLTYRGNLKGVVALAAADIDRLLKLRGLLLSYMGNVAALILHNYEIRTSEQRVLIDQERKRIAFDIHDGAAQRITHALQQLDLLRSMLEKQPAQSPPLSPAHLLTRINRTYSTLELSLQDLRQSISALLPAQLEEQGFNALLNELLDEIRADVPGLEVSCQMDKADMLPSALEGPIFRFMQEALNNVRKHAQATRVSLLIRSLSGYLVVEVSDNGRGFELDDKMAGQRVPHALTPHGGKEPRGERLGLHAMRERIQGLGGSWEVKSKPGEGTTLRARFPLTDTLILLTDREREVLRLVVEGLTNRAIAERLSVSVETIKSHMHHIMQKMQVKDRTQAAVVAARQHWLYTS